MCLIGRKLKLMSATQIWRSDRKTTINFLYSYELVQIKTLWTIMKDSINNTKNSVGNNNINRFDLAKWFSVKSHFQMFMPSSKLIDLVDNFFNNDNNISHGI